MMPITISDAEPRRVTLLDSPYRKIPTISVPTPQDLIGEVSKKDALA
jgi:hypothetical protein